MNYRPHHSIEITRRFPRLIQAMKQVAILSTGEAACAIRDYLDPNGDRWGAHRWGGGEAVVHFGGPAKVIERAILLRHGWRRSRCGTETDYSNPANL